MNEVKLPEPAKHPIGEWFDRLAYAVAPAWGAKRMAARRMFEMAERTASRYARAWEAADNDRFRGHSWLTSRLSPDANLERDLETLRERSHDLARNDPYAAGAINNLVCNAVGKGIRPQSRIEPVDGVISGDQARRWSDELEAIFSRWAEATSLDGLLTFYDQQRQWLQSWAEGGDVFIVESDVWNRERNSPIPLVLETIEAERCASPNGVSRNGNIRLGIEYDTGGRRAHYHFRRAHPGDPGATTFDRVPADRVCHIFEQIWPGQSRGFPWLSPVMPDLKDLKSYREAEIVGARVAACHTVFISGGDARSNARAQAQDGQEEIAPGRIVYMPDGSTVTLASPNRPGGGYSPFVEATLKSVAAGLNYPFEMLVKTYKGTTYSSGRLSLIDGRIMLCARWQQPLINRALKPIWKKVVREAVLFGDTSIPPSLYQAMPWLIEKHAWIPQGWPWVDPPKEIAAARDSMDGLLSSLTEELASRGIDIEEHFRVLQREREMRERYGIPDPQAKQEAPPAEPIDPDAEDATEEMEAALA